MAIPVAMGWSRDACQVCWGLLTSLWGEERFARRFPNAKKDESESPNSNKWRYPYLLRVAIADAERWLGEGFDRKALDEWHKMVTSSELSLTPTKRHGSQRSSNGQKYFKGCTTGTHVKNKHGNMELQKVKLIHHATTSTMLLIRVLILFCFAYNAVV